MRTPIDRPALRAAIRDSQQHGQSFAHFCARATSAGVRGYFAHLLGGRVTYYGRLGDLHTRVVPGPRADRRDGLALSAQATAPP